MVEQDVVIVGKDEQGLHLEAEWKFHNEAVQRVIDAMPASYKTRPPAFTDDLVTGRYYHKDELISLRKVAEEDPLGYNLVFGVAEAALIDGWRYVKEHGDLEEHPAAAAIHEDFKSIHAEYWLLQSMKDSRWAGDCLLYTGPQAAFTQDVIGEEAEKNGKLDVFPKDYFDLPTKADVGKIDKSSNRPIEVKIRPNPDDESQDQWVNYDEFIHVFHQRRGRSYDGMSCLLAPWTYITNTRHAAYHLGWAIQKFGTGAMMIFLGGRLTPDTEAALKKTFQKATTQRAGLLDSNLVDRIEYIGPAGSFANNIPEAITLFIKLIAASQNLPLSFLLGESGGASGSAPMEDKQFSDAVSKVRQKFVPYIRELARRRGHPTDWKIDFNVVFAKDEKEAALIRQLNADALLKEVQADNAQKLGPMLMQEGPEQSGDPKDPDKNNNPGGI
jgi:hypothetical protein